MLQVFMENKVFVLFVVVEGYCIGSTGRRHWHVWMWQDQGVFPCPRRLYNRLRLYLDMDQLGPSRQLRNVGICVIWQLLGLVRILLRPENGRNCGDTFDF